MKWAISIVALAACSHARQNGGADGGGADAIAGAPDAAANADGLPTGAIDFFLATGCPIGWTPYATANGRTIVPSDDPGKTVGAPLARNEVRAHHHDASVGVDLSSISYAGVAGAANTGVAAAGPVDGAIATDEGDAALPYVQLYTCEKTGPAGALAPPSGMIAFFEGACPAAWTDAGVGGRVLVGLPSGGAPGATFGGAPLASGETRTHTHVIAATLALPAHGIALVSGCCAGGYAAAGDLTVMATTAPAAVDLPYLQLRACAAP